MYVRILFKELGKLITFLSHSEITVGYNGIRDYLVPIYNFFFTSDMVEDSTRTDLHQDAIEQLVLITKALINDDRVELILPIML